MSIQQKRLYYSDSFLVQFSSTVVRQESADDGWNVWLNETAFYPTSGGQPHDTGSLGEIPVKDVFVEDGEVVHLVDAPLQVGSLVEGRIDFARRFDHMQHHTGQHLLSACFEQMYDMDTVGFHLGEEWVTIDLPQPVDWDIVRVVEQRANDVIWRDIPVSARFIDSSELEHLRLRHAPKVSSDIRIVSIGDFDNNACGGTHVASTGQVGLLKILRLERLRGGTRVTFLCGDRALRDYSRKQTLLDDLGERLSTGSSELLDAVSKLQDGYTNARKDLTSALQRLADYEASALIQKATRVGAATTVVGLVPELQDAAALRTIANAVVRHLEASGSYVVALAGSDGERTHVVTHIGSVPDMHAGNLVKSALGDAGKGGGSATTAQGSAPSPLLDAETLLLRLHESISVPN